MAVMAQWVFKPIPGQDPVAVVEFARQAMAVWTERGGRMTLWRELAGDHGRMRVVGEFDSFEAYGRAHDAVLADDRMRAWGVANAKSGTSEWIGSFLAGQIV